MVLPEMLDDIISWTFKVNDRCNQFFNDLVKIVTFKVSEWRAAGKELWNQFIEGIKDSYDRGVMKIKMLLSDFRGLFPHSEPKWGPLRGMTASGEELMRRFQDGLVRGARDMAREGALALEAPSLRAPSASGARGGNRTIQVGDIHIHIDGGGTDKETVGREVRRQVMAVLQEAAEAF
jgi:hypothetical protein